jgi:putative transposase
VYDFPQRFGSLQDARTWCDGFFTEYNHEHRHSGIGYHTPASVCPRTWQAPQWRS